MPSAYDSYNYEKYWKGREYEHLSEVAALKMFLAKIGNQELILDIGGGFGRLAPYYLPQTKKSILTDPSQKLLNLARKRLGSFSNIEFIHSGVEMLPEKNLPKATLAIMIRVLHHIEDTEKALEIVSNLVKPGGYFILEFANKLNFKARVRAFFRGDVTYAWEIIPTDLRCKTNVEKGTLPFLNHHPEAIVCILEKHGFKLLEVRSVSNFRNSFLKKVIPLKILLFISNLLQIPLGQSYFGPSIFVLAKKT